MSVGLTFDMMLDGKVVVINEVLIMIDNRQRECLNTRVWPSSPGSARHSETRERNDR
jgi:hypothetical protein